MYGKKLLCGRKPRGHELLSKAMKTSLSGRALNSRELGSIFQQFSHRFFFFFDSEQVKQTHQNTVADKSKPMKIISRHPIQDTFNASVSQKPEDASGTH